MLTVVKRLCPAITLIVLVSGILLLSDLDRRKTVSHPAVRSLPQIAVMQIISTPLLDVYVKGLMERLRDSGYVADDERNIHLFNPQGDLGTANAIAREIVSGGYDMVITASTVALQVVAKANQGVRMTHVFGGVTDPQGAGVGITGTAPDEHPPYMAGIGTFQPVTRVFEIARELNPQIKRVGVVWNPGEQCSEACLLKARAVCSRLGVELLEATVGNTSEVNDALRSLLSRGIDALWIGGDTVVHASSKMIFTLAAQSDIPVFTNDPEDVGHGAFFGLGADYTTVGQYTADMAVAVFKGKKPSSFSIDNVIPVQFKINTSMLEKFSPAWTLTDSLRALAAQGQKEAMHSPYRPQSGHRAAAVLSGKKPSDLPIEPTKNQVSIRPEVAKSAVRTEPLDLRMVLYSATEFSESCRDGLLEGLRRGGLKEGQDFTMRIYNAQGDMTTLSSIMTAVQSDQVDLLMVISTPTLQAALRLAGKDTNIVFAGVGDGVLAGAGRSETDHRPNVTGITTRSPFKGLARILSETLPGVKTVGTLFTPAEINSVLYKDWWAEALAPYGIDLVAVPVAGSSETSQAADVLCQKDIQAIGQIMDNTTRPGFIHLARKADDHGLPVFGFDSSQVKAGAVIALARDFFDSGVEASAKALRVLHGERPADIPFSNTRTEKLILNKSLARSFHLHLSPELVHKATLWKTK